MTTKHFNETDHWDCCIFYKIYLKNEEKYIRFLYGTNRIGGDNLYLEWAIDMYDVNCEMRLHDFLMWDYFYQKTQLLNKYPPHTTIVAPQEAYRKANLFLSTVLDSGKEDGSEKLNFCKITEDEKCGYYYGL